MLIFSVVERVILLLLELSLCLESVFHEHNPLWEDLDGDLVFWWSFRCHLCRRTHQAAGPVSGLSVNLFQAALLHPASSPLKSIRHRLGSEPPTGYEDDDPLLADDGYNHIRESSAILSLDGVFGLYKPTLCEAIPHHCNLLQFAGVLPFSGG
jgi:hypothetical protein